MSTTQGELAALSKYVFRAPRWYASVGFALVVAAVVGVAVFDSRYVLEDAWQGVFFVGLPTVVAGLLTAPVDQALGGRLTVKRASLLALASELVVVAVLTAAAVALWLPGVSQEFAFDALIAALALVFALRLLVVLAVSRNSWLAVVPASVQTLTAAVLLFVYSGTMRYLEVGGPILQSYLSRPDRAPPELLLVTPEDFVLLGGLSVLYAGAAYGLLRVIDRPWRRALGVSILDFASGFVGHVAEGSRELEAFFEEIGEEAVVPVTVCAFRRADGSEKARFVLPMIHPGPMGEIGGGNLPVRVAESTAGLAFPPHATAGHDFNLVTEDEVDTLVAAADRAVERLEYTDTATPAVRTDAGDATVLGQAVGDDGLLVASFGTFADDVEFSVGLSAAAEARAAGLEDVMLVDAHNYNDGLTGDHLGHVYPGSRRSFDLIEAAGATAERLSRTEQAPLSLGVAWDPTEWTPAEGIGPLGVRVAVVEAGEHTTAYVLVDGNNMDPGVRERLAEAVEGVDAVQVMTTDTHVVNTMESVNQVGSGLDAEALAATVSELAAAAREDLEPVEAGMESEQVAVTVFGNDRTEMLASHANALMAMGGALVGAVVLAAVAVSLLVLLFA